MDLSAATLPAQELEIPPGRGRSATLVIAPRPEELSASAFDAVVRIVLNGTFHCTVELGRRLIGRGAPGEVLAIVTTYTQTGSAFVVPSACAKAGVAASMNAASHAPTGHPVLTRHSPPSVPARPPTSSRQRRGCRRRVRPAAPTRSSGNAR